MRVRSLLAVVSIGLAAASVARPVAQSLRAAAPYAVLSADGRTTVTAVTAGDQEMLRLDELAALLQVTVREDRAAKALAVSRGTSVVVLSLDQGLASIGGKILSLSAAPVRDGSSWLVSPDTVNRALAPIAGVRVDVRRASRLIVLGDLRVPRITVQQESGGPPTRVAIDVAPRAAYTIVQEPRRLLVRFDADALDVGPLGAGGGPGAIGDLCRPGDPGHRARQERRHVPRGNRSGRRGHVSHPHRPRGRRRARFGPVRAGQGTAAASAGPAAPPPAAMAKPDAVPVLPAAQPPGVRTIVIDPGHGGDELGTQGAGGVLEKDLVLDVARRLRTVLDTRLGIRVLLTRDDDRMVPHDERASIANNNKADLFISLHANSSPSRSAKGAEVYYLSLDGLGAEARRMVESPETRPVPVLGGGSRDIDLILWDMAQARHLSESASFAMLVEEELRRRIEMGPNPHPAGAVPRAGRGEHAGRAGRNGVPQQSGAGDTADLGRFQEQGRSGAFRRDCPVSRPDRRAGGRAAFRSAMAVSTRIVALALIAAGAVGVGTWATVRYLSRPARGRLRARRAGGEGPEAAGASRRSSTTCPPMALRLAAAERDVLFAEHASEQARRIMEALLEPRARGPRLGDPRGHRAARRSSSAPGATPTWISAGASAPITPAAPLSELLTVYAIVSAITANLPAITSVQILIDGHEVDTLAGHVDLRRPLPNAPLWTKKGST